MQQRILIGLIVLSCVGCSSARDKNTREKIRTEYSNKNKKAKTSTKTRDSKTEKLEATSKVFVTNVTIQEYINTYKFIAMENMKVFGIPASIKLAQGILESGSGTGTLSKQANNHFGIKCAGNWDGESVAHTDDAPDECFRKYNSPLESFTDHSYFLSKRKHYSSLFNLDKKDYKAWANGLKKAGYATDPKYADKLIQIIESYQLYQYDNLVLANHVIYEPSNKQVLYLSSYQVNKGETLYSISKKFDMTVEELKEINKISDNNIKVGQTLKVK